MQSPVRAKSESVAITVFFRVKQLIYKPENDITPGLGLGT